MGMTAEEGWYGIGHDRVRSVEPPGRGREGNLHVCRFSSASRGASVGMGRMLLSRVDSWLGTMASIGIVS